jgi:hypothetical protein
MRRSNYSMSIAGMVAEKPEILFKTAVDGAFAVTGLKGRSYQVRAYRAEDLFAGTGTQSEPVQMLTSDDLRPVVLTLLRSGISRDKN